MERQARALVEDFFLFLESSRRLIFVDSNGKWVCYEMS